MTHWKPAKRTIIATLSATALPMPLAACGGSAAAVVTSKGTPGPTPTSQIAALISKVSSAYGSMGNLGLAAALPSWVTPGAGGKAVDVSITAKGSTFNGAAGGTTTLTVPSGWHIEVTLHNATTVAQSLVVTGQAAMPLPASGFLPAITGAATADAATGQLNSTQLVSFTASPAGNYLLVNAVSGRAAAGMWMHFDVSAAAQQPTVQVG